MSMSSHRIERTRRESFTLMLSLSQTLKEKEREIYLEPQATHDILLDTCSRMGGSGGRATWIMGSHSAEYNVGHLLQVDIICREESKATVATSPPPALVHHLNVSDDVIWIKGNLITSLSLVIIQSYS